MDDEIYTLRQFQMSLLYEYIVWRAFIGLCFKHQTINIIELAKKKKQISRAILYTEWKLHIKFQYQHTITWGKFGFYMKNKI